jgi:hypothetical protein
LLLKSEVRNKPLIGKAETPKHFDLNEKSRSQLAMFSNSAGVGWLKILI